MPEGSTHLQLADRQSAPYFDGLKYESLGALAWRLSEVKDAGAMSWRGTVQCKG